MMHNELLLFSLSLTLKKKGRRDRFSLLDLASQSLFASRDASFLFHRDHQRTHGNIIILTPVCRIWHGWERERQRRGIGGSDVLTSLFLPVAWLFFLRSHSESLGSRKLPFSESLFQSVVLVDGFIFFLRLDCLQMFYHGFSGPFLCILARA